MLQRLALLSILALSLHAQPDWELRKRGDISFGNEFRGIRAIVNVHGPNWSYSSASNGVAEIASNSQLKGHFPAPENCKGEIRYQIDLEKTDAGIELRTAIEFTEATEIIGAHLSFLLPPKQFEGLPASFLQTETKVVFPDEGTSMNLVKRATGLFAGKTSGIAITSKTPGTVTLRNGRQNGKGDYELRFTVFGDCTTFPGFKKQQTFLLTQTSEEKINAMLAKETPALTIQGNPPLMILGEKGALNLRDKQRKSIATIQLALHGPNWAYQSQSGAKLQGFNRSPQDAQVKGSIEARGNPAGTEMGFSESISILESGKLHLGYNLRFPKKTMLNGYQTSIDVPISQCDGKSYVIISADNQEGKPVAIPEKAKDSFLYGSSALGFIFAPGTPYSFAMRSSKPLHLLVQDNRKWGGSSIEFRFNYLRAGDNQETEANTVPAGHQQNASFEITLPQGTQTILDPKAAPSKTDTSDWFPFPLPWDKAPVDVSFLNHKPAGKYGFIQARDGKFVCADNGREIRFWGTCFSAGANFPSHEQSEKIARRLAAFGVNIVRTHHADAPWAERHFFSKEKDNTREFDPENLDRFDYLVHCLKREGIYVYLDQLVHRKFKTGDQVDAVADLPPAAKPYSIFDPRLIELQKEFSKNIWEHVNPYTKLAYKDDPAVALMEFNNENDLFTQGVSLEPYRSRLETRYRAWAKKNGVSVPPEKVNFENRTTPIMRFFIEVQSDYHRILGDYLRQEVGVKVPMTGSNWSRNAALLLALDNVSFTDSHAYHNHPYKGHFRNTSMLAGDRTIMDSLGFQSRNGKPFFVSEWDQPWPNEWRAELPIWMAAIAAFQGWNGLTVYTYRHSTRLPVDSISGAFETFNDPTRFGLFPHAALAYRRHDFRTSEEILNIYIPRKQAASANPPSPWASSAYRGLAETQRFRSTFDKTGATHPHNQAVAEGKQRRSSTGEIRRDIDKQLLLLDSPRTQVVTWKTPKTESMQTSNLSIESDASFATIALSSLEDQPLDHAKTILLTAVGRAENTGFKYNILRDQTLDKGKGPILTEPIRATISLQHQSKNLKIIPLFADGTKGKPISSKQQNERHQFKINDSEKTIYYLIFSAE